MLQRGVGGRERSQSTVDSSNKKLSREKAGSRSSGIFSQRAHKKKPSSGEQSKKIIDPILKSKLCKHYTTHSRHSRSRCEGDDASVLHCASWPCQSVAGWLAVAVRVCLLFRSSTRCKPPCSSVATFWIERQLSSVVLQSRSLSTLECD